VELLLLGRRDGRVWEAMARPGRKLRPGEPIEIDGADLCAEPLERNGDGTWIVRFDGPGDVDASLRAAGEVPLPPYIRDSRAPEDRYQTVYADREGSVAAPTAGLHFSQLLLQHLTESGIGMELVTLHVGAGTFKPVTVDRIEDHRMHAEWGEVPPRTAEVVNETRRAGGRVIAVGTTTTRLLESAWTGTAVEPFTGETDRFIYPGYQFGVIDGLVTNFHLPRSTLLMLVSAFAGRENVLRAYRVAVEEQYRFFSFGDAMLII
jgi:S-adenosylmethionine:tRNA ribosyltransferase-isomerase